VYHSALGDWICTTEHEFVNTLVRDTVDEVKRTIEWLQVLAMSAATQCRIAKWSCPRSVWRSVRAFLGIGSFEYTNRVVWAKRLRICMKCPLYDKEYRRCFNPNQTYETEDGITRPSGCGCYMPVKARLKDAECWLAEFDAAKW